MVWRPASYSISRGVYEELENRDAGLGVYAMG